MSSRTTTPATCGFPDSGSSRVHAVVPDHRRGHDDDLIAVRRIGEHFLVAGHVRREHDLGHALDVGISRRSPRKRVPSSRRRNPALVREDVTVLLGLESWPVVPRARAFGAGVSGVSGTADGALAPAWRGAGAPAPLTRERIEHGARRVRARAHDLQNEREGEEHAAAPPRDARQQSRGLPSADERVRRGGGAAEAGRQPTALS